MKSIILIIFIFFKCSSNASGIKLTKPHTQSLTWNKANTFCSSKNLRLPSIEELEVAFQEGLVYESSEVSIISKPIQKYWSSTETESDKSYVIITNDNPDSPSSRLNGKRFGLSKNFYAGVVCVSI
jgi:hypothetical protein